MTPWPVTCPHCGEPSCAQYSEVQYSQVPYKDPSETESAAPRLIALGCPNGHRFDAAKQGYVNLLTGRGSPMTPDSAQMILARERVQDAGVFTALSHRLTTVSQELLGQELPGPELLDPERLDLDTATHSSPADILDCGAGTGYYLHQVLDGFPANTSAEQPVSSDTAGKDSSGRAPRHVRGIAVDLSPAGLKRAAKDRRTLALGWDLRQPLPLASASIELLLNVFAPRNAEDYARVLRPGGWAVVVTPRPGHLQELATAGLLRMWAEKHQQLLNQFHPMFQCESHQRVAATVTVDPGLAADLVFMGPAGHHHSRTEIEGRIQDADISTVSLDLDITVFSTAAT